MIYVPFFNTEMFYPAGAKTLAHEPAPRPFVPRPPLISPVRNAPPSKAVQFEPLLAVTTAKPIQRAIPRPQDKRGLQQAGGDPQAQRRRGQRHQPPDLQRERSSSWKPVSLYIAPAKPLPPRRPPSHGSLIPTPTVRPQLARRPPYTPVPWPPPVALRRTAPLPLVDLVRR